MGDGSSLNRCSAHLARFGIARSSLARPHAHQFGTCSTTSPGGMEAHRLAASGGCSLYRFDVVPNHALQRTAASCLGFNRAVSWPPSLSLGLMQVFYRAYAGGFGCNLLSRAWHRRPANS